MRFLIVSILILTACAPSAQKEAAQKTLASKWQAHSPTWILDFSNVSFSNSFTITEQFTFGGTCQSSATISTLGGVINSDYGTLHISGSSELQPKSGDPNCSLFDGDWSYSVLADGLILCEISSGICVDLN